MNWTVGCCKEAVRKLNEMGIHGTTSARTIQNWNIHFRRNGKFPHPNPNIANGVKYKPLIFEFFPEIELDCKEFIFGNFDNFHVEMLQDELVSTIIPKQMAKLNQNQLVSNESEEFKLIEHMSTSPPAYSTVLKWVHAMGFKRDTAIWGWS